MNRKCPKCKLVNFTNVDECARCSFNFIEVSSLQTANPPKKKSLKSRIIKRAVVCAVVCLAALLGFYLSLIFTSKPLSREEKSRVMEAVAVLEKRGFSGDIFLLKYLTSFRANDNWLNARTREETAYAATNYPFEIMTVYPEFFIYPKDETERAAVLLHEVQHLYGADEKEAYTYVWQKRKQLGWTKETHGDSLVWRNVRKQTREIAPELFQCPEKEFGDCTE